MQRGLVGSEMCIRDRCRAVRFAWADPENGLLYIFMSNRVYPTRENSKLYELNIRTAMHQAIYDSIISESVSYTHLTLPTILLVQISVVAVSLKKNNKKYNQITM
eukprot:TRINITY_DN21737_c0_g1_i1.p1 TRINITY_DN21737_c0_g1~~TRINITY_DN21737_c0_g1_i1.p1  ORF type:complete len:105 (+),score=35.87 TRINITY_DN21737_c0_g1_i1:92-406(+)